jgi:hypothetical protein
LSRCGHELESVGQERSQHQLFSIGCGPGRQFGDDIEAVGFEPDWPFPHEAGLDAAGDSDQIAHGGLPQDVPAAANAGLNPRWAGRNLV